MLHSRNEVDDWKWSSGIGILIWASARVPTQPSSISKTKSKTADLSTWTGLPDQFLLESKW